MKQIEKKIKVKNRRPLLFCLLGGGTLIFRKIQKQAPDNYPNTSFADSDSILNDPDPGWNCGIWIRLKIVYEDGFIGYN